jgi:preprotein translocase SecE subunit
VAKSRQQRKAEKRAREAAEKRRAAGDGKDRGDGKKRASESAAQHDTQVPVSGDVAEVEAVEAGIGAGAAEADLETPDAPQTKSARALRRAEAKQAKEAGKRKKADRKRQEREQLAKRQKQAKTERQRGGVLGFLISCWQELRKVQWPDRDALVQATAVTIVFVAVAAAYLGALDAAFNFLIQRIL